ncbi:hypothetical protein Taro_007033 [Colocasia esculenta]|uniref:Uncharacterized protein n=1 Tax=Colocasia esculenta TaxID=4460 RepID=A0A843TU07_COLES|nr:hypothetical protein [Colocasia esculenta]
MSSQDSIVRTGATQNTVNSPCSPPKDATTPSSVGLPSHSKGTTPWIPHQVFLHNRREQHPGYH